MTNAMAWWLGATLIFSTAKAHAQAAPDFSGRWKLDSSVVMGGGRGDARGNASGGGGGGGGGTGMGPPAAELSIKQSDATLVIEERSDNDTIVITFRLDGKKSRNTVSAGLMRTTDAEYTTQWEGTRLVSTIMRSAPRGNGRIHYREARYVFGDSVMVVQTNVPGRAAGRTAYYTRIP
jgi:hypothetical protein